MSTNITESYVSALDRARQREGLSISAMARNSGVARPYLNNLLNGKHVPSLEKAGELAESIGYELRITIRKKK